MGDRITREKRLLNKVDAIIVNIKDMGTSQRAYRMVYTFSDSIKKNGKARPIKKSNQ